MRHAALLTIVAGIAGFISTVHADTAERAPFQIAEDFVLEAEKGFNDDDSEPGGASQDGVSQTLYDSWRSSHDLAEQPVKQMTPRERVAIYRQIWRAASCHKIAQIDQRVALVVFDEAVHRQPSTAIETLQSSLNRYWSRSDGQKIAIDGIWGPETKASLYPAGADKDDDEVIDVIEFQLDQREHWYRTETPPKRRERNLKGWLNRLTHLREVVAELQP